MTPVRKPAAKSARKAPAKSKQNADPSPKFFATPAQFRKWLDANHASRQELWVGFHKRDTGRPSMTWPQSVAEALCYGWIDGIRKSIDESSYTIRFTPRNPRSVWSQVNLRKVEELIAAGLMQPTGLTAYRARNPEQVNRYSFEQSGAAFDAAHEREFRKNRKAWEFFQSQPPSYRKPATWWVVSAKQEETRLRRLRALIDDSAAGLRIASMRKAEKKDAR